MFLMPISAYIDPAATTALIASFSGVVIVLSATAVIFFRKAKKKAADVLHIDVNANKEVEEELVIKQDETAE